MSSSLVAVRVAIAGAASLRGQDLKLQLEEANFSTTEIRLLDEEIVAGTLTESGGEPAVIEGVDKDSFDGARFAFFTGAPKFAASHGAEARRAGATVIDLSGGLTAEADARPWIPALDGVLPPPVGKVAPGESRTLFVAPSAPADVAISLSAALAPLGLLRLVLTFFRPVSERGREGVEELESQVAQLLSFEPISQKVFGTQVGFNMLSNYGEENSEKLSAVRAGHISEITTYLAGRAPIPAISVVQAPVFYSHAFTAYAEFKSKVASDELVSRMEAAGLKVVPQGEAPPTNVSVVGEPRPVFGRPELDPNIEGGVWLWGVADNIRVPVASAVAIAEKLIAS